MVAYKRFQILWFDLGTFGILKTGRRGGCLREVVATHVNHHPLGNRRVCSFHELGAPLLDLAMYYSADQRARLARDCKQRSRVNRGWLRGCCSFSWFLGNQKKQSAVEGKVFLSYWEKRNKTFYWGLHSDCGVVGMLFLWRVAEQLSSSFKTFCIVSFYNQAEITGNIPYQ